MLTWTTGINVNITVDKAKPGLLVFIFRIIMQQAVEFPDGHCIGNNLGSVPNAKEVITNKDVRHDHITTVLALLDEDDPTTERGRKILASRVVNRANDIRVAQGMGDIALPTTKTTFTFIANVVGVETESLRDNIWLPSGRWHGL